MNVQDVLNRAIKLVEEDGDLREPCVKYCPWCAIATAMSDLSMQGIGFDKPLVEARDALGKATSHIDDADWPTFVDSYVSKDVSLKVLRKALEFVNAT